MGCNCDKFNQIKSNLFEDTIIGIKQDFKAGKPALAEAQTHVEGFFLLSHDCKFIFLFICKLLFYCERKKSNGLNSN